MPLLFKRKRLTLHKQPRTLLTLQDLADFVQLCAEADLPPSTHIGVHCEGLRLPAFYLLAEGDVS